MLAGGYIEWRCSVVTPKPTRPSVERNVTPPSLRLGLDAPALVSRRKPTALIDVVDACQSKPWRKQRPARELEPPLELQIRSSG